MLKETFAQMGEWFDIAITWYLSIPWYAEFGLGIVLIIFLLWLSQFIEDSFWGYSDD